MDLINIGVALQRGTTEKVQDRDAAKARERADNFRHAQENVETVLKKYNTATPVPSFRTQNHH
jgi:hypothetical protein